MTRPAHSKGPPTEQHDFEDALRKGLGRAILHVQKHGAVGLEPSILHACLTDLRYDPMFEDVRSPYLYDLLHATGAPGDYLDSILEALAGDDGDSACQCCGLAMRYARDGSDRAREALYARMERGAAAEDTTGCDDVIELDGIVGFQRVARGHAWLADHEDVWLAGLWLENLEESLGTEEAHRQLGALDDPSANSLLVAIQRHLAAERKRMRRREPPPKDFATVYQQLRKNGSRFFESRLSWWGRDAGAEDVLQAAKALVAEVDMRTVGRLLTIFRHRRFPLDHAPLLALAHSEDPGIVHRAVQALRNIVHPSVRELGLEMMDDKDRAAYAIDLLKANYEDGDHALVLAACTSPSSNAEVRDSLGMSVMRFLEEHPSAVEGVQSLLALYEWVPCAFGRLGCVRRLTEFDALPDNLREECLWDCQEDTRALARGEAME